MRRFRRPSPAMVVACCALGIALGGTGVAATGVLAPNSVGSAQLKVDSVNSSKVANGSLLKADFKAGQLTGGAKGAKGATGARGATGAAGSAGAAGPAGPIGPSDAFAKSLNGPIAVPAATTTLVNLSIPQAGKYLLWAKAYFTAIASTTVSCSLVAGTDTDESKIYVSTSGYSTSNVVAHDFAAAGSADYKCSTPGTAKANFIKIAAIRVGSLASSG